jgi:hypothetical protein
MAFPLILHFTDVHQQVTDIQIPPGRKNEAREAQ